MGAHGHPRPPSAPRLTLTPREDEALTLQARGLTLVQIASRLGVSKNAVADILKRGRDVLASRRSLAALEREARAEKGGRA